MKGSFKTARAKVHSLCKTNFNDWSDPKSKFLNKVELEPTHHSRKEIELIEEEDLSQDVTSVTSQTSIQINQLRQKIRDGYPLLSLKEIRIFRLPFYESLLLNLKEDGFLGTYQFIKDLIDLDEEWHKQKLNRFAISKDRLYLKSHKPTLNILCSGLMLAEVANLDNNKNEEIKSLLETALHFSNPGEGCWHWLAEELYKQCLGIALELEDDCLENVSELEMTAMVKYFYAFFLLEVFNELEQAKFLVEESMKLSEGKIWKTANVDDKESDILYIESCLLLHKIFLMMALRDMSNDFDKAIQLCRSSLHWAKQTNNKEAEKTALLNLVVILIKAKQVSPVLSYLENYMSICSDLKDIHGLCEGYILRTDYHNLIEDEEAVVNDIQELLKVAEEHNILEMMALAHHKLAIYYMTKEKHKMMTHHAVKAYTIYMLLNSGVEKEEAKCLTGIAHAQEIMPQYIPLLLEAEDTDVPEYDALTTWKSLHIPFAVNNVELMHPEAATNATIKLRMDHAKSEEVKEAHQFRQTDMMSVSTMSFALRSMSKTGHPEDTSLATVGIGAKSSRSVMNFQRQMKTAMANETILSHITTF